MKPEEKISDFQLNMLNNLLHVSALCFGWLGFLYGFIFLQWDIVSSLIIGAPVFMFAELIIRIYWRKLMLFLIKILMGRI